MFYFPRNSGNVIIPIDVHIFQRRSNHQPVVNLVGGLEDGIYDQPWFFFDQQKSVKGETYKVVPPQLCLLVYNPNN